MSSTKKQPNDLACLGGQPLFAEKLYVGRPNLCDRGKLHAALDQIFDNRWLTNDGPFLRRFEERLQTFLVSLPWMLRKTHKLLRHVFRPIFFPGRFFRYNGNWDNWNKR